jgi:hypothetical protein
VLRVIREILFFEPRRRGTRLAGALDFLNRVAHHKTIAVLISDFQEPTVKAEGRRQKAEAQSGRRKTKSGKTERQEAAPEPGLRTPEPRPQNLEPITATGPAQAGSTSGVVGSPAFRPSAGFPNSSMSPQPAEAGTTNTAVQTSLRRANRRHDVVAVQITDRFEEELPALGRLVLRDAETDEVIEVNTGGLLRRRFAQGRSEARAELTRSFRALGIDFIQLRTDRPYAAALGRFFETREKRRLRG